MNRLLQNRGFLIHLIVYVAVNVLLIAINLLTTPDKLWFYWPLIGWGVAIIGHGFVVHRSERTSLAAKRRAARRTQ